MSSEKRAAKKVAATNEPSTQSCGCFDDGEGFALCDWHERRFRLFVDPPREIADGLRSQVRSLEADLSAIYGRMRHVHPDSVSCAKAGPKGHPPFFRELPVALVEAIINAAELLLAAALPAARPEGGLDVERLTAAFHSQFCSPRGHPVEYDRPIIENIAAEYARLEASS